jgi:biopolymer transport protein ExbD
VTDAGARPPTDGGTATGDVVEAPSAFAWDRTLSLALSVETDYVRIEVQGRVLRTLGHRPNERATLDATLRSLGQSLESLRRNNGWDRRVSVRTADAVVWGDLVAVLNVLVEAGFDQLVLTHVAAGG